MFSEKRGVEGKREIVNYVCVCIEAEGLERGCGSGRVYGREYSHKRRMNVKEKEAQRIHARRKRNTVDMDYRCGCHCEWAE